MNCHLWYSSPCAAGCGYNRPGGPNWKRGPATQRKILGRWKVHKQMWNGWVRLAAHAHERSATLTVEWAHDSSLHRQTAVARFMAKYRMVRRKVAGCAFGLKSICGPTRGMPLCKCWGIWTNNYPLSIALDGPHVQCPGGHVKVPVAGQNTAHSGAYPDDLALFVHTALTSSEDHMRQMIDMRAWPVNLECPTCSNTQRTSGTAGVFCERCL